jgi:hypothetical protein
MIQAQDDEMPVRLIINRGNLLRLSIAARYANMSAPLIARGLLKRRGLYAETSAAEKTVDVEHLDPLAAVRRLAELTFDHHETHAEFICLVKHREHPPSRAPARLGPVRRPRHACDRRHRPDTRTRPRRRYVHPRR